MTHLGKTGFAKPFRSQTACGLTASTLAIVEAKPECPACFDIYLQQRVNEEAEVDAFMRDSNGELRAYLEERGCI